MKYQYDTVGNLGGAYTFSTDQPFNPNDPASIARLTGAATFAASFPPVTTKHPSKYYVGFVQDDWKVRPNLTLNLGLRYERLYGNANEDLDPAMFSTPIPFIDVAARGDQDNFGPRTGLAWDVRGDGGSVVRAGWGLYYGNIRMLANLGEFRNLQQFSVSITRPAYPDPYQGQDPKTFITSAPPNIQVTSNDFKQPAAHQANIGISQRLSSEFAIHVDAVYNRTRDDYKTVDINPRDLVTGVRPLPQWARIDQTQSNSDLKTCPLHQARETLQPPPGSGLVYLRGAPTTRRSRVISIRSTTPSTSAPRTANAAMRSSPADRCCCRTTSRSGRCGPRARSCPGRRWPAAI